MSITSCSSQTQRVVDIQNSANQTADALGKGRLRDHVHELSHTIGMRNIENQYNFKKLEAAANYIEQQFRAMGFTEPNLKIHTYLATYKGQTYTMKNIEVIINSSPDCNSKNESIVIGAHYDTVSKSPDNTHPPKDEDSPGANDNASGVAALLEIARYMQQYDSKLKTTLKLVAFPNEESAYSRDPITNASWGDNMGSVDYAKKAKKNNEAIKGMIALECLGYYTDNPESQDYPAYLPPPLRWLIGLPYHSAGNFIGFVSNRDSKGFLNKCTSAYKKTKKHFPMHSIALPYKLDPGIGRSDHKSFWNQGYKAIMITDTADKRDVNYHGATDTIDKLNFESFTKVVEDLKAMTARLCEANENN